MARSQWEIITRQGKPSQRRDGYTGFSDRSVGNPRPITMSALTEAKSKRPNGEYMTELEWATYIMGKRTRARKVCPCPGKCECHIPPADRVTPALQEVKVPAATVYTLKRK